MDDESLRDAYYEAKPLYDSMDRKDRIYFTGEEFMQNYESEAKEFYFDVMPEYIDDVVYAKVEKKKAKSGGFTRVRRYAKKGNNTKDSATINIFVTKDCRKQGLGSKLIQDVIQYLKRNVPSIKHLLYACDKPNIASMKLAEKNGFSFSRMMKGTNGEDIWVGELDL